MESKMQTITGNTYAVKDRLKAMGGRWNPDQKAWMVPDDQATKARALVQGASTPATQNFRPNKCKVCGYVARTNSRGYWAGDKILRSGECQSCYEERKMGY